MALVSMETEGQAAIEQVFRTAQILSKPLSLKIAEGDHGGFAVILRR